MSQNVLDTMSLVGRVRVRAGWDNPLQELFCNVELLEGDLRVDGSASDCFYNTAYQDVNSMIQSLGEANIRLPKAMVETIERDRRDMAENVIRIFLEDGSIEA